MDLSDAGRPGPATARHGSPLPRCRPTDYIALLRQVAGACGVALPAGASFAALATPALLVTLTAHLFPSFLPPATAGARP